MTSITNESAPILAGRGAVRWLAYGWQFLRRWPVIPGIVIFILVFSAIFAPWIKPYDHLTSHGVFQQGPAWTAEGSTEFIFGTDDIGRDILSRMIEASRITVIVVLLSVVVGTVIGTILGLIAGYFGGSAIDEFIMRLVDVWAALPQLLILLTISLVFGAGITVLVTSLALISWPGAVRLVRVEALKLRNMDYVDSAKISGAGNRRILYKHILPGVLNTVLVATTLATGSLILTEATLSFLGAGIPPPSPSLGGMISGGRDFLRESPHIASIPGIALASIVMAGNFLGDWLRDRFDPRLRQIN